MQRKRLNRKLRLRRETVLVLGKDAMSGIRGGGSGMPICDPGNTATLATCVPSHHCTQQCPTVLVCTGGECLTEGGPCTG